MCYIFILCYWINVYYIIYNNDFLHSALGNSVFKMNEFFHICGIANLPFVQDDQMCLLTLKHNMLFGSFSHFEEQDHQVLHKHVPFYIIFVKNKTAFCCFLKIFGPQCMYKTVNVLCKNFSPAQLNSILTICMLFVWRQIPLQSAL